MAQIGGGKWHGHRCLLHAQVELVSLKIDVAETETLTVTEGSRLKLSETIDVSFAETATPYFHRPECPAM